MATAYADNIVLIVKTENDLKNTADILFKEGENWPENQRDKN